MEGQDLTALEGIGEVLAKKLREEGILTIENLAGRSANFLKAIGI